MYGPIHHFGPSCCLTRRAFSWQQDYYKGDSTGARVCFTTHGRAPEGNEAGLCYYVKK